MKWGSHEADALKRATEITLEELQSMDMTVELAADWALWYEEEVELNPLNDSARGRVVLMHRSVELLAGRS